MRGQPFRSLLLCVHKLRRANGLFHHSSMFLQMCGYARVLQWTVLLCMSKPYKYALFYHRLLPSVQGLFSIHQKCVLPYRSLLPCVHRLPRANGLFHHLSTLLKNCVHDCPTLPDILQTQMTSPLPKVRQSICVCSSFSPIKSQ